MRKVVGVVASLVIAGAAVGCGDEKPTRQTTSTLKPVPAFKAKRRCKPAPAGAQSVELQLGYSKTGTAIFDRSQSQIEQALPQRGGGSIGFQVASQWMIVKRKNRAVFTASNPRVEQTISPQQQDVSDIELQSLLEINVPLRVVVALKEDGSWKKIINLQEQNTRLQSGYRRLAGITNPAAENYLTGISKNIAAGGFGDEIPAMDDVDSLTGFVGMHFRLKTGSKVKASAAIPIVGKKVPASFVFNTISRSDKQGCFRGLMTINVKKQGLTGASKGLGKRIGNSAAGNEIRSKFQIYRLQIENRFAYDAGRKQMVFSQRTRRLDTNLSKSVSILDLHRK